MIAQTANPTNGTALALTNGTAANATTMPMQRSIGMLQTAPRKLDPFTSDEFLQVTPLPQQADVQALQQLKAIRDRKQELLRVVSRLQSLPSNATGLHRIILMEGPSGTGKSTLARGIPSIWMSQELQKTRTQTATTIGAMRLASQPETASYLMRLNGHALASGERGGTQRQILKLRDRLVAAATRANQLFLVIDEVETVALNRLHVDPSTNPVDTSLAVNAFIETLDVLAQYPNLILLLTTNLPQQLDPAVLNRVALRMKCPLLGPQGRLLVLQDSLCQIVPQFAARAKQGEFSEVQMQQLVQLTRGFSPRELRQVVQTAFLTHPGPRLQLHDVVAEVKRRRTGTKPSERPVNRASSWFGQWWPWSNPMTPTNPTAPESTVSKPNVTVPTAAPVSPGENTVCGESAASE